jgi:isopenicillin-N epimerase
MYKNLSEVSKEEIVDSVVGAIRDETRILGITWVHASSGLKIAL